MKKKIEIFISPQGKRFQFDFKDTNKIPTLTEDDRNFAETICKEYPDLVKDDIFLLARVLRFNLIGDDALELMKFSRSFESLFDPNLEVEKIIFDTNKGQLKLKSSDPLFKYFLVPIEKLKRKFTSDAKLLSAFLEQGAKDGAFGIVVDFFYQTTLGPWQRLVAIGMTALHFKLFAREPILTEAEWGRTQSNVNSYKHYLAENVEPRVITVLKEFDNFSEE